MAVPAEVLCGGFRPDHGQTPIHTRERPGLRVLARIRVVDGKVIANIPIVNLNTGERTLPKTNGATVVDDSLATPTSEVTS